MGAVTEEKGEYDALAVRWFEARGWRAHAVAKPGRFCDVVAVRGSELAVVEVKSPAEKSVASGYNDVAGMSAAVRGALPAGFSGWRKMLCGRLGCGAAGLYAVAAACQLRRYVWEFAEKGGVYAAATGEAALTAAVAARIQAFLVVPAEMRRQAEEGLAAVQRGGCIVGYAGQEGDRIFMVQIFY